MRLVPIDVQCPHCESRFRLQADLLGKQVRCPACREVYTVAEVAAPPEPLSPESVSSSPPESKRGGSRADLPESGYQTGTVGDLVPILSAEAESEVTPVRVDPADRQPPTLLEPAQLIAPALSPDSSP